MKEKSDTTLDFLEYACFLDLTTEANIFHKYTHTQNLTLKVKSKILKNGLKFVPI